MSSYHYQNEEVLEIKLFISPAEMKEELEVLIQRSLRNKTPGRDGFHTEVLKVDPELMA